MAEEERSVDDDCADNQWCSKVSNIFHANECGQCFEGFSAKSRLIPNKESDMCSELAENDVKRDNTLQCVGIGISIGIGLAILILVVIRTLKKYQQPNVAVRSRRPPITVRCQKRRRLATFSGMENPYPESTEYGFHTDDHTEVAGDGCKAFKPPYWIQPDPNYNPENREDRSWEEQTVQSTSSSHDIMPYDEEDNRRPALLIEGNVFEQPIAALDGEVQVNTSRHGAVHSRFRKRVLAGDASISEQPITALDEEVQVNTSRHGAVHSRFKKKRKSTIIDVIRHKFSLISRRKQKNK